MGFFIAFLGWFAYAPLMTTIRDYVDITKGDIGTAGIVSVGSTIFTRFAVGPAIDRWGPRRCMVRCQAPLILLAPADSASPC